MKKLPHYLLCIGNFVLMFANNAHSADNVSAYGDLAKINWEKIDRQMIEIINSLQELNFKDIADMIAASEELSTNFNFPVDKLVSLKKRAKEECKNSQYKPVSFMYEGHRILVESEMREIRARMEPKNLKMKFNIFAFHPKDKIGDGAFGKVYRGKQYPFFHSDLAIKISDAIEITKRNTAINETKMLELCDTKRAAFTVGNEHYLIYDYLIAVSAESILYANDKRLRVSNSVAVAVAIETLANIIDLHNKGILHRDIKPSNLLLSVERHDQKFSVTSKLCDFGSACTIGNATEEFVGTRPWATDNALGFDGEKHEYTYNFDLYSWGLVVLVFFSEYDWIDYFLKKSMQGKTIFKEAQIKEALPDVYHSKSTNRLIKSLLTFAKKCVKDQWYNRPTKAEAGDFLNKILVLKIKLDSTQDPMPTNSPENPLLSPHPKEKYPAMTNKKLVKSMLTDSSSSECSEISSPRSLFGSSSDSHHSSPASNRVSPDGRRSSTGRRVSFAEQLLSFDRRSSTDKSSPKKQSGRLYYPTLPNDHDH